MDGSIRKIRNSVFAHKHRKERRKELTQFNFGIVKLQVCWRRRWDWPRRCLTRMPGDRTNGPAALLNFSHRILGRPAGGEERHRHHPVPRRRYLHGAFCINRGRGALPPGIFHGASRSRHHTGGSLPTLEREVSLRHRAVVHEQSLPVTARFSAPRPMPDRAVRQRGEGRASAPVDWESRLMPDKGLEHHEPHHPHQRP